MKWLSRSIALVLAMGLTNAVAQEPPPELEPPPLPDPIRSGEVIEPDVTIIQRQEEDVVEYRYAGRLVAIKVIPKNKDFPAYYLVDSDNDGKLDIRTNELDDILINSWVLFSW